MNISVTCFYEFFCGWHGGFKWGRREVDGNSTTTVFVGTALCPECGTVPKVVIDFYSKVVE